ncbi:MAG: hypothetical protein FWE37_05245 [Spirochaetaceae bacterium]|nr:hypothetical protein [Spirochaetaceae bacterium]
MQLKNNGKSLFLRINDEIEEFKEGEVRIFPDGQAEALLEAFSSLELLNEEA